MRVSNSCRESRLARFFSSVGSAVPNVAEIVGCLPGHGIKHRRLQADIGIGMVGKFEAVLDPQLRSPRPEIARVGERPNDQGRERSWRLRRKEQAVLPCDQGCVLPIQTNDGSTQSHHTGVRTIVGSGKSAPEVEVDVAAGVCPEDVWPKDLEAKNRLPKRASYRARRVHRV